MRRHPLPAHVAGGGAATRRTPEPERAVAARVVPKVEGVCIEAGTPGGDRTIVVHPANVAGRYRFGARRWRAAKLAGLDRVPVIVRAAPADPYAQVAENQRRHRLTPPDLARFIRGRIEAGESNSEVARQLGMNLTTVAHHLVLLELPPVLDDAMKSGRFTSPRTLHELGKLHDQNPEQVQRLLASGAEITRAAVLAFRVTLSSTVGERPIRVSAGQVPRPSR